MTLPTAAKDRKETPIATGAVDYFPDALAAVAHVSFVGNEQHNPGTPLHWDRAKSTDEADALMRHFVERGTLDADGIRHSAKVAWRALAMLQKEIEAERDVDPRLVARDAAVIAPFRLDRAAELEWAAMGEKLRLAAEDCYRPSWSEEGRVSPHVEWPIGDPRHGHCAGCGITRAQAAALGHEFLY